MTRITGVPAELMDGQEEWHEFRIPQETVVSDLLQEYALCTAEIPLEKILALNGLWVKPISVRMSNIAVDTVEIAGALREEKRGEEAAWWEGFRQRGLYSHATVAPIDFLFFPKDWLSELGADVKFHEDNRD